MNEDGTEVYAILTKESEFIVYDACVWWSIRRTMYVQSISLYYMNV